MSHLLPVGDYGQTVLRTHKALCRYCDLFQSILLSVKHEIQFGRRCFGGLDRGKHRRETYTSRRHNQRRGRKRFYCIEPIFVAHGTCHQHRIGGIDPDGGKIDRMAFSIAYHSFQFCRTGVLKNAYDERENEIFNIPSFHQSKFKLLSNW